MGPDHAWGDCAQIVESLVVSGYTATRGTVPTFSLQIVSMTSSGGVPSNSVMMENWLTSECMNRLVEETSCICIAYGLSRETKVFLQASQQRCILYSRCQQQHRIFATSTWFQGHGSIALKRIPSFEDPEYVLNRNRKSTYLVNRYELP